MLKKTFSIINIINFTYKIMYSSVVYWSIILGSGPEDAGSNPAGAIINNKILFLYEIYYFNYHIAINSCEFCPY